MTDFSIVQRLESGPPLIMDGAMSTELAARGLVFNEREWLHINLDRPEVVAEIHASYARAGAELHIANSFATARHVTEYYGFPDSFEALNRSAVELCRAAVESAGTGRQWIAGSISTYAPNHDRGLLPDLDQMEENCRDQALILASAGCDLIVLEMIARGDMGAAMLKGAADAGLPVSVGIICDRHAEGTLVMRHRTLEPEPVTTGLTRILEVAPSQAQIIVTVMHTDVEQTTAVLDEVRASWSGLTGAYPHTGCPDGKGGWDMTEGCDQEAFTQTCQDSVDGGVCFVGGCCGIGPDYIRALAQRLSA